MKIKFEEIITFLLMLVILICSLTFYAIRIEKIENGELILVNQNQMDR